NEKLERLSEQQLQLFEKLARFPSSSSNFSRSSARFSSSSLDFSRSWLVFRAAARTFRKARELPEKRVDLPKSWPTFREVGPLPGKLARCTAHKRVYHRRRSAATPARLSPSQCPNRLS